MLFTGNTGNDDDGITAEIITTSSFYDDTSVMQSNNEKLSIKGDVHTYDTYTEATDDVAVLKNVWSLVLYYSYMLSSITKPVLCGSPATIGNIIQLLLSISYYYYYYYCEKIGKNGSYVLLYRSNVTTICFLDILHRKKTVWKAADCLYYNMPFGI